jgi:hypothetical protein
MSTPRFLAALAALLCAASAAAAATSWRQGGGPAAHGLAVEFAREAAGTPSVMEALRAANGRRLPLPEIQRIDAAWAATRGVDARMQALMEGPCAAGLKAVQAKSGKVAGAALLDAQGTVVCMTSKAEHYYWGEQIDFAYAFNNGLGQVYLGKATFDEAAGDYVVPAMAPVMSGGKAIGAVSLRLMVGQ